MKVELGLGVVFVCLFAASSAQLWEERQPPHGAQAIGAHASSNGRSTTGARSAKPDNLNCALPTSEGAVRLEPHSAQAHYNLDPRLAPALGNLGIIGANQGDNAGAEKLVREAIRDDPNYAQGHTNLALILASMGDIDKGEQELRLAQALKPADPDIERALGRIALARTKRVSHPDAERAH